MTSKQPHRQLYQCRACEYQCSVETACKNPPFVGCIFNSDIGAVWEASHSSAPAPDVDCHTCLFSAQCRVIPYIPPCYNHGPDSPARAAEQAKREERERIAKQIEHNATNRKYHSYTTAMQIVESLRGEQP